MELLSDLHLILVVALPPRWPGCCGVSACDRRLQGELCLQLKGAEIRAAASAQGSNPTEDIVGEEVHICKCLGREGVSISPPRLAGAPHALAVSVREKAPLLHPVQETLLA